MPKKALASLNVVINAVTGPLQRGLKRASRTVERFGNRMKNVGRSITSSFTMPFAAISVAGAKMAIEFEQSMTKINTLVGTSAEEVNKLADEVKAMAIETATPAKELADALFFIQSAGIKGAESIETLRVSAKAASMQMGEITDIASATTSIMEAFGKSSSEAGDLLHETLKQGKFEAAEFMGKIGQVIPTAAGLGVSFEELGAAVATMSKLSGDASGSLTAINQVMMKLGVPSAEQKEILSDLNMSYEDLNVMMKDSLMGTLNHLFKSLEGNDEMLVKVFGSSRAVKGAFATAGLQAETYADVLDGMHRSQGNIDKGFQTQVKTVGFDMKQAFERLKQAGMELGAVLMPLFTDFLDIAKKFAKGFTDLDSGTKKLVAGAAALVALSGPLMTIAGGIITLFSGILTPIGLATVALSGVFYVIVKNWETVRKILVDFINYWIDLYNEVELFRAAVATISTGFKILWATVKYTFGNIWAKIKLVGENSVSLFSGVGNVIAGALKGGVDGAIQLKKGIDQVLGSLEKDIEDKIGDHQRWLDFGTDVSNAISDGVAMLRDKAEFITEDDIQNNIDNVESWLINKLDTLKKSLKGYLGGSNLLVPEGKKEEGGGFIGPRLEDGSFFPNMEGEIEESKSLWATFTSWMDNNWEGTVGNLKEGWGKISLFAGQVIDGISGLWAAQSNKAMTIFENEKTRKQELLDSEYETQKAIIEKTIGDQKSKDDALLALRETFDDRQGTLDQEMDTKKKALSKEQAKRDKKMKIMSAIMGTANAVVNALTLVPPPAGIVLAGIVAGLGAAQIATIASTPIPLAKGGLAFGPTNAIVGDNPNAANDPEVIAPLSKLTNILNEQMNLNIEVAGVVKGNDIYISNQNTIQQRERYI